MIITLYTSKFEEYTSLLKEQESPRPKKDILAEVENEDGLDAVIRKLKCLELEREIYNLRDSLATSVLPKLVELDIELVTIAVFSASLD